MICYRDRTFCSEQTCANVRCRQLVTDEIRKAARDMGLGICVTNMKRVTDSGETCGYVAKGEEPGVESGSGGASVRRS